MRLCARSRRRWRAEGCLLSIIAAVMVLQACARGGDAVSDGWNEGFCGYLDSLSAAGLHTEMISVAVPAFRKAEESSDGSAAARIGCRIGRAYYYLFRPDSMYWYFDRAFPYAEAAGMCRERMIMLNTLGVFNMVNAINYSQALDYFYQAMGIASECGNRADYYSSLTNVTIIHYYRKDPEGVETARQVYEYGIAEGDREREYYGALMLAYMYHALGNDDDAMEYAARAMQYPQYAGGTGSPEPLLASVLAARGRDAEAERIYLGCIGNPQTDNTVLLEALSGYGRFLASRGRQPEAVRYFLKGLDITEKHHLYFYGHSIYRDLADVCSSMGKYDKALEYLAQYQHITDDVFNVERERSFNMLLRKFDKQLAQTELQRKDLQIMRQRQSIVMIAAALILLVVLTAAVYTNYRMRDRMYKQLVIKYNESQRREHALQEAYCEEENAEDGKLRQLFRRLDGMMTGSGLYGMKNLTIEEAAKLLGTNRGYISKAVNQYAGMPFNAYVNSYRIKAAVSVLSDPSDATPIKVLADRLGYNNLTSFYNNFYKETGVPPSKFRNQMRKMPETSEEEAGEQL